jgi:hypothetical protein
MRINMRDDINQTMLREKNNRTSRDMEMDREMEREMERERERERER